MAYLANQNIIKENGTGNGAINVSLSVPADADPTFPLKRFYRLHSVSCKFDSAPTTSENFTVTLDANAGALYDVELYVLDPGATSTTDFMWMPDRPIYLEGGDAVDVTYTGTDGRTFGVQITAEVV